MDWKHLNRLGYQRWQPTQAGLMDEPEYSIMQNPIMLFNNSLKTRLILNNTLKTIPYQHHRFQNAQSTYQQQHASKNYNMQANYQGDTNIIPF